MSSLAARHDGLGDVTIDPADDVAIAADALINNEYEEVTIDNVTFGQNPREGYFVGNTFIQPDLAIQMRFPRGWRTSRARGAAARRRARSG